ncbi:uncharacterized protein L969DRAFT_15845 [Mixia osmundae IAM 14324]|uniref:uncharacterized protein n=1 Tax=Mixia osmundae (strain CBS 9802 / IAM 14324 / JCM 22182 / KY 12970) TaxID=764103 RepID=UPI0004A549F4|nr:uncharacterized protein L969DRAFT_15845 [Mixia osmundae IAM 14324]KEI40486.1 hypothetical protein L969DRAFT_15845 [Mixia osmundae IAM 14324]
MVTLVNPATVKIWIKPDGMMVGDVDCYSYDRYASPVCKLRRIAVTPDVIDYQGSICFDGLTSCLAETFNACCRTTSCFDFVLAFAPIRQYRLERRRLSSRCYRHQQAATPDLCGSWILQDTVDFVCTPIVPGECDAMETLRPKAAEGADESDTAIGGSRPGSLRSS